MGASSRNSKNFWNTDAWFFDFQNKRKTAWTEKGPGCQWIPCRFLSVKDCAHGPEDQRKAAQQRLGFCRSAVKADALNWCEWFLELNFEPRKLTRGAAAWFSHGQNKMKNSPNREEPRLLVDRIGASGCWN